MKTKSLLLILLSIVMSFSAQAKTYKVGVALANFDLNFVSILRSQMVSELMQLGMDGQFVDAKGDVALQV
ncbi:MAG: rhizopine-binding protein, partial [Serratia liquefaciens]|nr:rhizopine-binding protein [Serratia liquefaciens]